MNIKMKMTEELLEASKLLRGAAFALEAAHVANDALLRRVSELKKELQQTYAAKQEAEVAAGWRVLL